MAKPMIRKLKSGEYRLYSRKVNPRTGNDEVASMPLEILHVALVLFGGRAGPEGAEISALAGSRIDLARIEPVLAALQFADHGFCHRFNAPRGFNRDDPRRVPSAHFVGWAKRSVPTILIARPGGGHGASAPLPTLRFPAH